MTSADVIVVGAGLAGLVAAAELTAAGRTVALLDQEGPDDLGGQAYWSLGGLFLVDSPEQRRLGVKDSVELAWSDWQGSAQFDRLDDQDRWAVQWAYLPRRLPVQRTCSGARGGAGAGLTGQASSAARSSRAR